METKKNTAQIFADLLIEKMEEMKNDNWQKPWFGYDRKINFYPANITGRHYTSGNALLLLMLAITEEYNTPLFLTFKQCKDLNISIIKGQKSFPIYYYNISVYHKETNEKITFEEYRQLSEDEKRDYKTRSFTNLYRVFNLDQTNYKDIYPEKYNNLLNEYRVENISVDTETFAECEQIDTMLNNNSWLCDISLEKGESAFYRKSDDKIVCPLKEQFPNQNNFYSVLLHEMTHSTGIEKRLNREMGGAFGDSKYAREEVIAELTAALSCFHLGIAKLPLNDSVTYLNSWISVLKETPNLVFSLLDDAVKASNLILDTIQVEANVNIAV